MDSNSKQKLALLLDHLSKPARTTGQALLPFSQVDGGLPAGAITEISGPIGGGKTEVVLRFLAENHSCPVAWIESHFTLYPCRLPQLRVDLGRVLFVESQKEYLWALGQALRSQLFKILVLRASPVGEIDLRRLQIAAERAGVVLILLTEYRTIQGAWPIAVQLQVMRGTPSGEVVLKILKYPGRQNGLIHSLRNKDNAVVEGVSHQQLIHVG
jgi:hypothetical protein